MAEPDPAKRIWHSVFRGGRWRAPVLIPFHWTRAPAAIADVDGVLHQVHLGAGERPLGRPSDKRQSYHLWHSTYSGGRWTSAVDVPGHRSERAPALASLRGQLHMVHRGMSDGLWHSRFEGTGWTPARAISGQATKDTPTLVARDGRLHLLYVGEKSNYIWHSIFDGTSWTSARRLADQSTKKPVGLAARTSAADDRLYLVHCSKSLNHLWSSTSNGDRSGDWTPNRKIVGHTSHFSPALAYLGELHMIYLPDPAFGGDSDTRVLAHATYDGVTWSPAARLDDHRSRLEPRLAVTWGEVHMLHVGHAAID